MSPLVPKMAALIAQIATLIYVAAIFAMASRLPSLVLAAQERYGSQGLTYRLDVLKLVLAGGVAALTLVLLLTHWRKLGRGLVWFLAVGAATGGLMFAHDNPLEFLHPPEYAFLALLIFWSVPGVSPGRRGLLAVGVAVGLALGDELFQGLIPERFFTWGDLALDGCGVALAGLWLWLAAPSRRVPQAPEGPPGSPHSEPFSPS